MFVTIAVGYLVGNIKVFGLSAGASGVLFVALAMGHFGYHVPEGIGHLGLVVFVYCLGLNAGPSFLRVFGTQGKVLVALGTALVVSSVGTAWGVARLTHISVDLVCGIFAGSMTSTPALAATNEVLPPDSQAAVGFGIAYPFGVLGVVLFVQLLPRLLGKTFVELEAEAGGIQSQPPIRRETVEVANPAVAGRQLGDLLTIQNSNCQITRVLQAGEFRPIPPDFTLELGQIVLAVGPRADVEIACELLGRKCEPARFVLDVEQRRSKVVVSSKEVIGKSLRELKLLSRFGVTIARISRHEFEFVPRSDDVLQFGDALTVVGEPDSLHNFAEFAGHRERAFDETNIISLALGLVLGVAVGQLQVNLGQLSFSLGMAGGPLLVGLMLGHLSHIGPFVGHLPRASRLLLTDLGLAFFLADAGISAGAGLASVLQAHGLVLCGGAIAITAVPMLVGLVLGRYVLKLSLLQVMGTLCGGMTSTPGLGVINAKTDSNVPIASYAAVYPIALFLVTICGRLLVTFLE